LSHYNAPSYETVKRWVKRVGYYKLHCPKERADDWTVIIDASIQLGSQKALVIIGCRSSSLQFGRAPTLQDFEPLSLKVVNKLTAKVVEESLKTVSESIGGISSICSDRGSDILLGIKNFKSTNPNTRQICDTAHFIANRLQRKLQKNDRWISFRNEVTQSRRKLQHSLAAGAMAPSPREKARFMNIDSLVEWALNMLVLIDDLETVIGPNIALDQKFRDELTWLKGYRSEIIHWKQLTLIGKAARNIVRLEGIHPMISEGFVNSLCELDLTVNELPFADNVTEFLMEQAKGLKIGERFLGTSEPIEAMFGKMKALEKDQRAFGFTSLTLVTLAAVGPLNESTVRAAMEEVKHSDLEKWHKNEIGETVQKQRQHIKKLVFSNP
jgi:hypothetical protein